VRSWGAAVPTLPPMSERDFQQVITDLAQYCGWCYYHTHDSRRSQAGWPDLAIYRPGHFMLRELKTDKGRVSNAQYITINGLRLAGVDVGVWRPRDLDRIRVELAP